jgi:hypothetical protein
MDPIKPLLDASESWPAVFPFRLRTLFVLTAITAVVLVPARLLFSDPVFRTAAAVYVTTLTAYFVLRGPFLWVRLRRLQMRSQAVEEERRRILADAKRRRDG